MSRKRKRLPLFGVRVWLGQKRLPLSMSKKRKRLPLSVLVMERKWPKLQKIKIIKPCEGRSGVVMKDIPLDGVSNSSGKGIREDGNRDVTIKGVSEERGNNGWIAKEWPPLEDCPQCIYGLINLYVFRKYPWEDQGNEDVWFNMYEPRLDVETMREDLLIAKKFLHQVRTTRGYGVTCDLPLHCASFTPLDGPERDENYFVEKSMQLALTHISQKTGKPYQLVKIENVVNSHGRKIMFLTFDAKTGHTVPETFLAMVHYFGSNIGVMECLLKPDCEADWGANEDKVHLGPYKIRKRPPPLLLKGRT